MLGEGPPTHVYVSLSVAKKCGSDVEHFGPDVDRDLDEAGNRIEGIL